MNALCFISWAPEAWSAAGTWATAIIAAAAALFAWRQVGEARKLREAQAQPFIIVTLEPSAEATHVIVLRVENVGHTLAKDVTFTFDPPLSSVLARRDPTFDLTKSRLLTEGLPSMPPGMRIERVFDNVVEWEDDDRERQLRPYDVEVRFSDHTGTAQEPLRYRIDLGASMRGHFIDVKTTHHAAEALREIRDVMKRWTDNASPGLKVWSRDGDARIDRERQRYEEVEERRRQQREDGSQES